MKHLVHLLQQLAKRHTRMTLPSSTQASTSQQAPTMPSHMPNTIQLWPPRPVNSHDPLSFKILEISQNEIFKLLRGVKKQPWKQSSAAQKNPHNQETPTTRWFRVQRRRWHFLESCVGCLCSKPTSYLTH